MSAEIPDIVEAALLGEWVWEQTSRERHAMSSGRWGAIGLWDLYGIGAYVPRCSLAYILLNAGTYEYRVFVFSFEYLKFLEMTANFASLADAKFAAMRELVLQQRCST